MLFLNKKKMSYSSVTTNLLVRYSCDTVYSNYVFCLQLQFEADCNAFFELPVVTP